MPKKSVSPTTKFEPSAPKPRVTAKIQVVHPETLAPIYANYVEVAHTEYDFSIALCKLPAKLRPQQLSEIQGGQPLTLEPTVVVEIPTRLIKGLIRTLETQVETYEKVYGPLPDSAAKKGEPTHGKSTKKV